MSDVERITQEEITKITVDEWQNTVNHVIKLENEYWQSVPKEFDGPAVILNLDSSSESSTDEDNSSILSVDSEF